MQGTPYASRAGLLFDPITKSKLDRWVAAKREKDFGTADAIRSELRAMGIEPDSVRPPDRELQPHTLVDSAVRAKLDRWVAAKREKDFGTADAIRAELHAVGIEPDQLRPPDRDFPPSLNSSMLPGARFDPETEAKLDRWVQAKREKEWTLADSIRSELRALGIEPDVVRPPDRDLQPNVQLDPITEAKLDRWVLAKREKDFGTADAIRAELRAAGLEPDSLRPPDRDLPTLSRSAGKTYDAFTEAQLDRWVQAKRDKDFVTADTIRAELRARGIEPDLVRPSDRDTAPLLQQQAQQHLQMQQQQQLQQLQQLHQQQSLLAPGSEFTVPGFQPNAGLQTVPHMTPPSTPPPGIPPVPQLTPNWALVNGSAVDQQGQVFPGNTLNQSPGLSVDLQGQTFVSSALDLQGQAFATAGTLELHGSQTFPSASLDHQALLGQVLQPLTLQASPSLISRVSTRVYDPETEALLDRWVASKREKDFAAADAIRAELRSKGIEPDNVRPSDKDLKEKFALRQIEPTVIPAVTQTQWGSLAALNLSPGLQREVERQLDRWVEARRAKDHRTAESIRRLLQAKGIDPDVARPMVDLEEGPAKRARGSGELGRM